MCWTMADADSSYSVCRDGSSVYSNRSRENI
jgi:hypothetical protein